MNRNYCLFAMLFLGVCCRAASDELDRRLSQFIAGPPSGTRSTTRVQFRGGNLCYTPLAITSARQQADVTLDGMPLRVPAYIRRGRTYIALRAFLAELQLRYHLNFDVDYLDENKVAIRKQESAPVESDFGRGWKYLWQGNVPEAVVSLERAGVGTGPEADDARALAHWLDKGTVIRIAWWHLPEDVTVYIDEEKIVRGVPLVRADPGVHRLRLVTPEGDEILAQRFRTRPDRAFVVQFGDSGTK